MWTLEVNDNTSSLSSCVSDFVPDEGMTFKSQKYGEIAGWRPDRCRFISWIPIGHHSELRYNIWVCATVTEAANQAYSYVIVATKIVPEVETTPQLLAPLIEEPYLTKFPQPTFVLFQNGISIEKDLYQALKTRRPSEDPHIISASVYIASRLVSKNVAEHSYFVSPPIFRLLTREMNHKSAVGPRRHRNVSHHSQHSH